MHHPTLQTHATSSPHEWRRLTFFFVIFFFWHRAFHSLRYRVRAGAEFFFFCIELVSWNDPERRSRSISFFELIWDFTLNQWEKGNNQAECVTRVGYDKSTKLRTTEQEHNWIQSNRGLSTGFNKQNNLIRKINKIKSEYETLSSFFCFFLFLFYFQVQEFLVDELHNPFPSSKDPLSLAD